MPHDQLFKELLQAFFREFMELFFAEFVARLDFSRVTFLNQEVFTDLPQGDVREADLVAQVYTIDGQPEIILTHIEVEARRRSNFGERMFEYYMMLRLRHRVPVKPIVVYLSPGAGGLVTEQFVDRVFNEVVNVFYYSAVGLPDLNSDHYLELENPLGHALSALMKTSRLGKVAQKYQSLRAMARTRIDEARKSLLTNVVETYLTLEAEEQREFQRLLAAPEGKEVGELISIYEERGIEKGIVRGKRETLLRMLRLKFGDLPERLQTRIEAMSDIDELNRLTDRFVTAQTLADFDIAGN